MELASCHTSGAYNFEAASAVLKNLCTPAYVSHITLRTHIKSIVIQRQQNGVYGVRTVSPEEK
jgi:hypothetical protein